MSLSLSAASQSSIVRVLRSGALLKNGKYQPFYSLKTQSEKILLFRLHFFDHYIKVECFSMYLLAIYSFISDELLDYLS